MVPAKIKGSVIPQIVRDIDAIAAERGGSVLFLRFGCNFPLPLRDVSAKRQRTLERLDTAGLNYEPCGPPSASGWLS